MSNDSLSILTNRNASEDLHLLRRSMDPCGSDTTRAAPFRSSVPLDVILFSEAQAKENTPNIYEQFIILINSKSYTFRQLFDFCDKYEPYFIKYVVLNGNNWKISTKPNNEYNKYYDKQRYIAYNEINRFSTFGEVWHVVTHEYNPELIDSYLKKENIDYFLMYDSKNSYLVSTEYIHDTQLILKDQHDETLYQIKMGWIS